MQQLAGYLADIVVGSCNERALNCTLSNDMLEPTHSPKHTGTYNPLSQYSHLPRARFAPLPLGPLPSESRFRFLLCLPLLFAGFAASTRLRLAAATLSRCACLAFDLLLSAAPELGAEPSLHVHAQPERLRERQVLEHSVWATNPFSVQPIGRYTRWD